MAKKSTTHFKKISCLGIGLLFSACGGGSENATSDTSAAAQPALAKFDFPAASDANLLDFNSIPVGNYRLASVMGRIQAKVIGSGIAQFDLSYKIQDDYPQVTTCDASKADIDQLRDHPLLHRYSFDMETDIRATHGHTSALNVINHAIAVRPDSYGISSCSTDVDLKENSEEMGMMRELFANSNARHHGKLAEADTAQGLWKGAILKSDNGGFQLRYQIVNGSDVVTGAVTYDLVQPTDASDEVASLRLYKEDPLTSAQDSIDIEAKVYPELRDARIDFESKLRAGTFTLQDWINLEDIQYSVQKIMEAQNGSTVFPGQADPQALLDSYWRWRKYHQLLTAEARAVDELVDQASQLPSLKHIPASQAANSKPAKGVIYSTKSLSEHKRSIEEEIQVVREARQSIEKALESKSSIQVCLNTAKITEELAALDLRTYGENISYIVIEDGKEISLDSDPTFTADLQTLNQEDLALRRVMEKAQSQLQSE